MYPVQPAPSHQRHGDSRQGSGCQPGAVVGGMLPGPAGIVDGATRFDRGLVDVRDQVVDLGPPIARHHQTRRMPRARDARVDQHAFELLTRLFAPLGEAVLPRRRVKTHRGSVSHSGLALIDARSLFRAIGTSIVTPTQRSGARMSDQTPDGYSTPPPPPPPGVPSSPSSPSSPSFSPPPGAPPPPPIPVAATTTWRSLRGLTTALTVLLWLAAADAVFGVVAYINRINVLGDIIDGRFDSDIVQRSNDSRPAQCRDDHLGAAQRRDLRVDHHLDVPGDEEQRNARTLERPPVTGMGYRRLVHSVREPRHPRADPPGSLARF